MCSNTKKTGLRGFTEEMLFGCDNRKRSQQSISQKTSRVFKLNKTVGLIFSCGFICCLKVEQVFLERSMKDGGSFFSKYNNICCCWQFYRNFVKKWDINSGGENTQICHFIISQHLIIKSHAFEMWPKWKYYQKHSLCNRMLTVSVILLWSGWMKKTTLQQRFLEGNQTKTLFRRRNFSHETTHFCRGSAFLLHDNGVLKPLKPQTFETGFQSAVFWNRNLLFDRVNWQTAKPVTAMTKLMLMLA